MKVLSALLLSVMLVRTKVIAFVLEDYEPTHGRVEPQACLPTPHKSQPTEIESYNVIRMNYCTDGMSVYVAQLVCCISFKQLIFN